MIQIDPGSPQAQGVSQKRNMLSSLWEGFKATVVSFVSNLSPSTWFGSKTTSVIGDFFRDGLRYCAMSDPYTGHMVSEPVTPKHVGKSFHHDAQPMTEEDALTSMRYQAGISLTSGFGWGKSTTQYYGRFVDKDYYPEFISENQKTFSRPDVDFLYTNPETGIVQNAEVDFSKIEGNFKTEVSEHGIAHHTDLETGLTFTAFKDAKSGEIVVSFPGLGQGAMIPGIEGDLQRVEAFANAQLSAVSGQLAGGIPKSYKQAAAIVAQLQSGNPTNEVVTSGFSYGGSVAQYAALKNGTRGYCFNGLAIGAGLQRDVGNDALEKADEKIQHFGINQDWVTDLKGVRSLDKMMGAIGLRTPGNFGQKHILTYNNEGLGAQKRHVQFLSFMAHYAVGSLPEAGARKANEAGAGGGG